MELNDRRNIAPYNRSIQDGIDPPNIVMLLNNRQYGIRHKSVHQLKKFAELKATVSEMQETHCELPPSARSTFLMSFSHDCSKVASTHGDHNIYVSDVKTGKHIQKLEGHPRTPWCIAFHPTSTDILASGCLAGEVRVWDLHGGSEKWKAEHDQVIASLAFHPFLQLLVIATGSCLYFWDWSQPKPAACCSTYSALERVRYVKFDHYGHRLITGISNESACSSGSSFRSFTESVRPPNTSETENLRLSRRNTSDNHTSEEPSHSARDRSPIYPRPSWTVDMENPESDVSSFTDALRRVRHLWESRGTEGLLPHSTHRYLHFTDFPSIGDISSDSEDIVDILRDIDPQQFRVIDVHSSFLEPPSFPESDPEPDYISELEHASDAELEPVSDDDYSNDVSSPTEPGAAPSSDIWNTCVRLRTICTELENRLINEIYQQSDDLQPRAGPSSDRNVDIGNIAVITGADSAGNEYPNMLMMHGFIINMLARIRLGLRFSSISLAHVRDRIDQVRRRIREIISRLRCWTRRRNIGQLQQNFFEEMTVQLTEQMDRLTNSVGLSHQRITQNLEQTSAANHDLPSTSTYTEHSISRSQQGSRHFSNERNNILRLSPGEAYLPSPSQLHNRQQNSGSSRTNPENSLRHRVRIRQRRRPRQHPVTITLGSDDEGSSFSESFMRWLSEPPRRNSIINEPASLQEVSERSNRRIVSDAAAAEHYPGMRIEYISDDSDSDRPLTPPLLMYSPTYTSLLFNGTSRIALNDPLTQNHRIQSWDFSQHALPAIYDANANIVVRRCMIHNDASVDISQDGEKLVALIPPEDRDGVNLMFGVFSLKAGNLGKTHCIWGYVSNAISVSFSPLAQYVIVGSAYSRPVYSNPEKTAVAQIIKINQSNDTYEPVYIRSFTQLITNENRFQEISLNCVRWLPQSGLGIAYATNRGCLCICKPTSPMFLKKYKTHQQNSVMQSSSISLGLGPPGRDSSGAGEMFENSDEPFPVSGRQRRGIRIYRAIP